MQSFFKIDGPASRFFGAFPLFAVQQQRQANHHMVHRLVPNDVDDFIQRAERIPIHLNIAYGMCEGELGIGQRKSDPSITQIDTKPNHAWRISPSEPGRPMPQVPRRSWWRPRRHPVRSPACRRHHRQEPWKRHGPDHQLDALLACRFVGCHGDHGLAVLVHAGKSHHDRSIFAELAAHVEHGLAKRVEGAEMSNVLLGDLDRSEEALASATSVGTEAASWDSYIAARRRSDSLSLASSMFTRSASSSGRALTMSESWETSACSRALTHTRPGRRPRPRGARRNR